MISCGSNRHGEWAAGTSGATEWDGHSQKTFYERFDDVNPTDRRRITDDVFEELLRHIPRAAGSETRTTVKE